jgi:signal peptidase I
VEQDQDRNGLPRRPPPPVPPSAWTPGRANARDDRPAARPPLGRGERTVPTRRAVRAEDEPTEVVGEPVRDDPWPPPPPAAAEPEPAAVTDAAASPGAATEPPGRHRRRAGASGTAAKTAQPGRRRRSSFWKELPLLVVVALVLTFLIQTFLAKVYVIPSGSMEATLHGCVGCNNDRVLVDKITYRFSGPAPGDVVVFRGPDSWSSEVIVTEPSNALVRGLQLLGSLVGLAPPDEKDFVKRVIAVGGQTVQCCDSDNRVLVDDKPLTEPYVYYLLEAGPARQSAFGPVQVPAGQLWMMGDSRNNSADSRVADHGPVPVANVIGKARMIVLPFSRFGPIGSVDPQITALGPATAGSAPLTGDDAVPLTLGLLGVLPLARTRRRRADLDGFLPDRACDASTRPLP